MLRDYTGATVIGRAISVMALACALAGIILEGVVIEIPGRSVPPEVNLHRADVS